MLIQDRPRPPRLRERRHRRLARRLVAVPDLLRFYQFDTSVALERHSSQLWEPEIAGSLAHREKEDSRYQDVWGILVISGLPPGSIDGSPR
jgi:hypothetical protein